MNTSEKAPIESILEAIGEHLGARAKQASLKKKDLAALADVNQNTITAIMAGGDLKVSTLIRLSRVLNDTEWLSFFLETPKPTPLEQLKLSQKNQKKNKSKLKPAARKMGRTPVSN
jgi:transcriptional regulator with XRE-family HTH domain